MYDRDAQSQTSSTRGTEIREPERPSNSQGQEGARTDGRTAPDFSVRTSRTAGPGGIVGGILAQMIAAAEDDLGNARACLDWYQAEEAKALRKLEELRKLQEGIESDQSEDSEA